MKPSPTPRASRPRIFPTLALPLITLSFITISFLALAATAGAQTPPSFQKSFSPTTIGPGSAAMLRFDIVNSSGSPARELAFVDNLPAGMTLANPANAASSCDGTLSAPDGGGTISLVDGALGGGGSCVITVNVTAATPGTLTNTTGDLTSTLGNSGTASAALTVATNRPGFSKSFSPSAVNFGGRSTLTFTIDNTANASAMTNLTFTDALPAGMVVASPANASTTCTGGVVTAPAGGSTISMTPPSFGTGSVAAGGSCTVSVDVLGNAVGRLVNTSGELSSFPSPSGTTVTSGRATAALSVTIERIALTKSFTDDPVPAGETVTLSFTVRNLSRDFEAIDITFSDDLGAVLSGLVATGLPQNDVCGPGSVLSGTSVVTLSGGNLGVEASCTFSVTLQVPAGAASGSYTNVTSEINAEVGGRPETGAPATDVLVVQATPRLTKSYVDDPVGGGGTVTLEFTITNTSPDQTLTDVAFSDVFDIILPSASSVPAAGFCGAGSTATFIPPSSAATAQLSISGASLAPGASCTFSLVLNVVAGAGAGNYPNTTSAITGILGGGAVTGNPASDTLVVVAAPFITKELIDDPVAPGDTVTLQFTLEHDELAPGDASAITFSDNLDAVISGLVATGLPQTDVCGAGSQLSGTMTLLLTGGVLAPGESCAFSVTLQVPSTATAGPHTNTTSAVVAEVLGVETVGRAASNVLNIAGLTLTKEFIDDPVIPGTSVTLRFTIDNDSPTASATSIQFQDNLSAVISGLVATTPLPLTDVCGTGSALAGSAGNALLTFTGGSLAAGATCSFDVTLAVPAGTPSGFYHNSTSNFRAIIDGNLVSFTNATDDLEVVGDLLAMTKEFTDDPVGPGETVHLRFTITNVSDSQSVENVGFTDDLDSVLEGLVSTSGTLADVCGTGSQISGASLLTFTGGSLGPAATCTFEVALSVPEEVDLGTVALNVTSDVTGQVSGVDVSGLPATDTLAIDFLNFSKSFSGEVEAGDVVSLTFTITNLSATDAIEDLSFTDDLDTVLEGLAAIGLPTTDVCGEGSALDGTSVLTFTGGSLLPGGSCSFSVDLQVPEDAAVGEYLNVTSELTQLGTGVAAPATATLSVVALGDADGDGVLDEDDLCPGTVIPESVPTVELRPLRYALVDADFIFDTVAPAGGNPPRVYTTTDTGGCSCEQIIAALHLGIGNTKHGCNSGAMRRWADMVAAGFEEVVFRTER